MSSATKFSPGTPKIDYKGRWIEQRDTIIQCFGTDWKPPFQPRVKFQIIQDSPISQIVFEAYNSEKPSLSKVLSYIKLLNGQFKTLAACSILTQHRATGVPLDRIIREVFEEIRARDGSVIALCSHCGKDLLQGVTVAQKPYWQR